MGRIEVGAVGGVEEVSQFLIYALHNDSSLHVYVGRSKNGLQRPQSHRWRSKRGHYPVYQWVRALLSRGENYSIAVLEECSAESELNDAERFHIEYLRSIGVPLLNCTDGGDGARNPVPATRLKMSLAKKGRPLDPQHRENIAASMRGRTFTPEWCAKISAAKKGNSPKEHIVALNKSRAGRPLSDATKQKLSMVHRGRSYPQLRRKGEEHSRAKLKQRDVDAIRSSQEAAKDLAVKYGVSKSTIYAVRSGQNWRAA